MESYTSSGYKNIDHPIDRSIMGTCALTIVFLILSLALVGPFLVILIPSIIVAALCRLIITTFICQSSSPTPRFPSTSSSANRQNHNTTAPTPSSASRSDDAIHPKTNVYYSPNQPLTANEMRWLDSASSSGSCSKIMILLILDSGIELENLRNIILTRIIQLRKEDNISGIDSSSVTTQQQQQQQQQQQHQHHAPSNGLGSRTQLVYPRFSQILTKAKIGWKWKYDANFNIENHVHHWKIPMTSSVLSCSDKLSTFLTQIDNLQMDLSKPAWDSFLVNLEDSIQGIDLRNSRRSRNDPDSQSKRQNPLQRSLFVLRIHPSISDGVSLVRALCLSLSDEPICPALKDRFFSSGKLFNAVRGVFVGPVVFVQKWLLTRRDYNIFHPLWSIPRLNQSNIPRTPTINNNSTINKSNNSSEKLSNENLRDQELFKSNDLTSVASCVERSFLYCSYPLSTVTRIKCITRSTITELFLAAVSGALRSYQQQIAGVSHPFDLLGLLPTDLSKEKRIRTNQYNTQYVSNTGNGNQNNTQSSRMGGTHQPTSRFSHASSTDELYATVSYSSSKFSSINNNYSIVEFELPCNTEGCIPRLWQVKLRMEQLKSSADSIVMAGLVKWLDFILPNSTGQSIMNYFHNKSSVVLNSLQGPSQTITIDGKLLHNVVYWLPVLADVTTSISCFTYADSFICSVAAERNQLPKLQLILDSIVYQFDLLNKLLEHRRIPGEHKTQKFVSSAIEETKPPSIASAAVIAAHKTDSTDKALLLQGLSPSISSDHLYSRLANIQNQLQNDDELSQDELDSLRSEFSSLLGILRRRKSCGIDANGEPADFDEELEEMPEVVSNRRPSLSGLMALSTRRRSLAASLARPLNTTNRSRSNSRPALHISAVQLSSTNYLSHSQVSPSTSQRPSLLLSPDDIEAGISHNMELIQTPASTSNMDRRHLQARPENLRVSHSTNSSLHNNPDSPYDNTADYFPPTTISQRSSPIQLQQQLSGTSNNPGTNSSNNNNNSNNSRSQTSHATPSNSSGSTSKQSYSRRLREDQV